jgi:hypothetical protein
MRPQEGDVARLSPADGVSHMARPKTAGSTERGLSVGAFEAKKSTSVFANMRALGAAKTADRRQGKVARSAQEIGSEQKRADLNIFEASRNGSLNLLKDMVAAGQPIDARDGERRTPLHYAAAGDYPELVEWLCKEGAPADAETPKGVSPLHEAASGGVAEILIKAKANVNGEDEWSQAPLHHASQAGRADVVRVIVHFGGAINQSDGMGRTPLHIGAQKGNLEVVEELASAGANLGVFDRHRRTPLDLARSFQQHKVAALLGQMESLLGTPILPRAFSATLLNICRLWFWQSWVTARATHYAHSHGSKTHCSSWPTAIAVVCYSCS